jgi:hypothetical protein
MRLVLLALLLIPQIAAAQAGRLLVASGDAVVVRGSQEIAATPGTAVQPGDTIRVGPRSNVQIRMSDGSIFALRADTILRIDEYVHTGGERDRSIFSLVKGGLRTVTGAIARTRGAPTADTAAAPTKTVFTGARREDQGAFTRLARAVTGVAGRTDTTRHAVRSPSGTIGVRGTHYTVVQCDNDCFVSGRGGELAPNGTYIGTSDGFVGFVNNAGDREFGPQSFFHVASLDSAPATLIGPPAFLYDRLESQERARGQTTSSGSGAESTVDLTRSGLNAESRPSEPPAAPAPEPFVVTEERNSAGEPTVVSGHTPMGPAPTNAFLGAFTHSAVAGAGTGGGFVDNPQITVSGTGDARILEGFNIPASPNASQAISGSVSSPTAVINQTVPNPINAYWGRWQGGTVTDTNGSTTISSTNQFHYLVALNTPPEIIAAKTGSFAFTIVQFTTPTNNLGHTGTFTLTGGLTVDFTGRTVSLGASSFVFPASSQNWTFSAASPAAIQFAPAGAFISTAASGSCAGGSCATSSPATLLANGIFLGSGDHLGMALNARAPAAPASAQTIQIFSCAPTCN